MRGWVYVFSNKAMPGLVKVGYSMKDPALRVEELKSTGMPFPFEIQYEALLQNPREVEQNVHTALGDKREKGEFFRCDAFEAVRLIRVIAGESILYEQSHELWKYDPAAWAERKAEIERRYRLGLPIDHLVG